MPTNLQPEFKTLDESIAYEKDSNVWFNISAGIVTVSGVIGALAKVILGREFTTEDPYIGVLLMPFSAIFLIAFMHMFYVMVKIRLSVFTRILCKLFFVITSFIIVKFFIVENWLF